MIDDNDVRDPSPPEHQSNLTDSAREAGQEARRRAAGVQEAAGEALSDAKESAQEKAESVKGQAADEIERTAHGLEAAADELGDAPLQQELLREAADGLSQLARTVQNKSLGALVGDLSDFGRQNPVAYLGGAALAGFALARFARASAPEPARGFADRSRRFETERSRAFAPEASASPARSSLEGSGADRNEPVGSATTTGTTPTGTTTPGKTTSGTTPTGTTTTGKTTPGTTTPGATTPGTKIGGSNNG